MEVPHAAPHYFVESRPGVPDTDSADCIVFGGLLEPSMRPRLQLTTAPVLTSRHAAVSAERGLARPPSRTTAETCIAVRAGLPLPES